MATKTAKLNAKIIAGERITIAEAVELYSFDLLDLGALADLRRSMALPSEQVGFIVDRIINFTNICEAACRFCAFHSKAERIAPYELSLEDIIARVAALAAVGGTQVMLQGGLHPDYRLDTYLRLVTSVKEAFPAIYLHSFSPAELIHISRKTGKTLDDVVAALKDAGLESVPGASDILVDAVRARVSPRKITVSEWVSVMETLHRHDMKSSATMTYGMGETIDDRIEHLGVVRDVQDRTDIIRAFIPWSFSPAMTAMEDILPATGVEYLRMAAIARIFLDNVTYIQAGWLTEGMKLGQIALSFGANDMGGVLTEEVVVKATGIETRTNTSEMIDIIKNASKRPVQRDSDYQVIREF